MHMRRFGALISALSISSLVFTGTAVADEPPPAADVAVSAAFDQPAYNSDDHVGVDVTITNNGTDEQTVSGFDGFETGELALDPDSFDTLLQNRTLASGETTTLHLTGTIRETTDDHNVIFTVTVSPQQQDENPDDNTTTISAPVTQLYGVVEGHVYTDDNHNGSYDAGEGLAQVNVHLEDYWMLEGPTTTTGADGSYRFDEVPTGSYYVEFTSSAGWVFPHEPATDVTHLGLTRDAIARRPLTDTLRATATFDKLRYQSGATAIVTVKVRNTGATAIQGVHALYGGAGTDADLKDVDCGALNTGVDVPANHTVTIKCTGKVTHKAAVLGLVSFFAHLGTDSDDSGPGASATARAGNHLGYADVWMAYDANGNGVADDDEGVAGVKVTLIDPNTGGVIARATSDANGNFTVKDIPTGAYRLHAAAPWQPSGTLTLWVTTKGACGAFCGRWTELVVPRT